jgi:acetyl-CoA acyltransferase
MPDALIVEALRTPVGRGKVGGALSHVQPADLLGGLLRALVERTGIDPVVVDDVIVGCVSQVGEQSGLVGRLAWLGAGLPEQVPCVMVDRRCGSSQQALHFAAQGVMAGSYDVVIAAGVESMSRVPMFSARMSQNPEGAGLAQRYPGGLVTQGICAERIAARWAISREEMDVYAERSHRLAAAARHAGRFAREIVPVGPVAQDETIRPDTTSHALAALKTSFEDAGMARRFPDIRWGTTAGNSSQLADGAAAVLIVSDRVVSRLGLRPLARFVAFDVIGDDPLMMLSAPIPATRRVLAKAGLAAAAIDHYEVNEAFASVPLAWQREIAVPMERLNPLGGAIALGHPLGASGARLMATMVHALHARGGRYGLQVMCEAGGLANATIVEKT